MEGKQAYGGGDVGWYKVHIPDWRSARGSLRDMVQRLYEIGDVVEDFSRPGVVTGFEKINGKAYVIIALDTEQESDAFISHVKLDLGELVPKGTLWVWSRSG